MGNELIVGHLLDGAGPDEQVPHRFAARVTPFGTPTEDALAAIRAHVLDPEILEAHPPFIFRAEVSNTNLDSYFTRMAVSSLRNYATDAQAGVALLDSHNAREQPLGRTFAGRVVGGQGNGVARLEEDFYVLSGLFPNGPARLGTDDLIRGLRSGTSRDVSIGFYGGEYRCSICGNDMMNWRECRHFPGIAYPLFDQHGNETGETEVATAWIENARQAEASIVYDGATPGCMVLKARALAEMGELRGAAAQLVAVRYRIRLPGSDPVFVQGVAQEAQAERTPAASREGKESDMDVRAILTELGAPEGTDHRWLLDEVKRLRAVETEAESLRTAATEAAELRTLADIGRAYRADLIEEALAEGIRGMGEKFPQESYRALLERAGLDEIKAIRDTLKAQGDARFPGGRATDEGDAADEAPREERTIPSVVFAG